MVLVEVHGHAEHPVAEVEQLVGERPGQPGDVGDAVTGVDDATDLLLRSGGLVALEHLLDGVGDVLRPDRRVQPWFRSSSSPACGALV
jgi:hypothetical protein